LNPEKPNSKKSAEVPVHGLSDGRMDVWFAADRSIPASNVILMGATICGTGAAGVGMACTAPHAIGTNSAQRPALAGDERFAGPGGEAVIVNAHVRAKSKRLAGRAIPGSDWMLLGWAAP